MCVFFDFRSNKDFLAMKTMELEFISQIRGNSFLAKLDSDSTKLKLWRLFISFLLYFSFIQNSMCRFNYFSVVVFFVLDFEGRSAAAAYDTIPLWMKLLIK